MVAPLLLGVACCLLQNPARYRPRERVGGTRHVVLKEGRALPSSRMELLWSVLQN